MALPLPAFFDPAKVSEIWRVPYEERAREARAWAREHTLRPASEDRFRVGMLLIDPQNTFCIPGFELFVGGRSGRAAVDDMQRLVAFIYRNLDVITSITVTMDTHQAAQIFHALFWVDAEGQHPEPFTLITHGDVVSGRWRFNPALAPHLGVSGEEGEALVRHYTHALATRGRYTLTIWPYHAMLGGIGHALVPAVEEAIFFHSVARQAPARYEVKGACPFTEHYSALRPEVTCGPRGEQWGGGSTDFARLLREMDMLIIAGEAKSHCVAWTVADLLEAIADTEPALAQKVYLLEDCCSAVVVPGIVDYGEEADRAFRCFAEAGMHCVRSTDDEAWLRRHVEVAR